MNQRLDLILVAMAGMAAAQLQWRFMPEKAFQVLLGLAVVVYLWLLVTGYRKPVEEHDETKGAMRWLPVTALLLFALYIVLRFMWFAAGR